MRIVSLLCVISFSLCACQAETTQEAVADPATAKLAPVMAKAETMPTSRDGANDPVIWIDTANPENSLILGAATEGGLEVYALDGSRINSLPERPITLVDVRYNFPLDGEKTDLAVAYDIANSELVIYAIDETARTLQEVTANPLQTAAELEGLCMYQSPLSLKYYVFAVGAGMIQQWELYDQDGKVAGRQIRSVPVGFGAGHCVVHDREATLYFSQESVGVWKVSAEPESDAETEAIDYAQPFGHFRGDVKGLAIVESGDEGGYLLVSDADVSQFHVYELESGDHLGTTAIEAGASIDGVEETEGMAAVSMALGSAYPAGLLVLTDDDNDGENTNYKLVSWATLANSLGLEVRAPHDPTTPMSSSKITVSASAETEPAFSYGDSADDPAIWVHPENPALSLVIGTQKKRGINIYDMSGALLQSLADGRLNNVDLRYGFELGGETVDVVTASNRSTDSISIYIVDAESRGLIEVADGIIPTGMADPYGLCMYRSQTGNYYVFVNDPDGIVKQWQLLDSGNGKIGAKLLREFSVGSQTEGCVADDESGDLYIGEEDFGIWKYSAEPDGGDERILVDQVDAGNISADVEGMALYYGPNGSGYLLVSIQGTDNYAVYERAGENRFIGLFHVVADEETGIDGTSETDGLDVSSANLGPAFPNGAFIAQDGRNITPDERQNYKFVPWERIAAAMGLDIHSGYDLRSAESE